MSKQKVNSGRQITVGGLLVYTTIWALIFGLYGQAAKLTEGVHTLAQFELANILGMLATGLVFVAIGLAIAFVAGKVRQAVPISLGCFVLGLFALPLLYATLMILVRYGVIDLD